MFPWCEGPDHDAWVIKQVPFTLLLLFHDSTELCEMAQAPGVMVSGMCIGKFDRTNVFQTYIELDV